MRYRLYFVDVKPPPGESVDLSKLMSVAFDSKDDAMERAREYMRRGATVLRISGPDGFVEYFDSES
jgi:hypothetical protein